MEPWLKNVDLHYVNFIFLDHHQDHDGLWRYLVSHKSEIILEEDDNESADKADQPILSKLFLQALADLRIISKERGVAHRDFDSQTPLINEYRIAVQKKEKRRMPIPCWAERILPVP